MFNQIPSSRCFSTLFAMRFGRHVLFKHIYFGCKMVQYYPKRTLHYYTRLMWRSGYPKRLWSEPDWHLVSHFYKTVSNGMLFTFWTIHHKLKFVHLHIILMASYSYMIYQSIRFLPSDLSHLKRGRFSWKWIVMYSSTHDCSRHLLKERVNWGKGMWKCKWLV
jgi:hypothetical protein